jgi:hypothetical protein
MSSDYIKYKKYKLKYLKLKESNQTGGMNNYCNLPKKSKLFFGSGGSKAIIALTKDSAYKYFPLVIYPGTTSTGIKKTNNHNKYEIQVIKLLTKNIVKPDLSPHIIEYINNFKCTKSIDNIFKDCPSYEEHLLSKKKPKKKCLLTYLNHPILLKSPMHVLQMEKAHDTLENEIIKISKEKWEKIELFMNRLFFQTFYTLEMIKKIYPDYNHNDLFIRNILTMNNNNNDDNDYYRYNYKKKVFDMPVNGLFIKINDFGMNDLTQELSNKYNFNGKNLKNPNRDYFSIIYDVYNGGNMGGKSLYKLIKNKDKLKMIDKYFNKFFNIKIIKKIIDNNKKNYLDWDWNKTYDENFCELVELKKLSDYIEYFVDIYPKNDSHNIIKEFGL